MSLVRFLAFWRCIDLRLWTFLTTPSALSDKKHTAHLAGVDLASVFVYQVGRGFEDSTGLALVIETSDLLAEFEVAL